MKAFAKKCNSAEKSPLNFFFPFSHLPKNLHTPTYTYIMYTRMQSIPPKPSQVAFTHNTRPYKLKHARTHHNRSNHTLPTRGTFTQSQLLSLYRFLLCRDRRIKKKFRKKKKKKNLPEIVCPASGRLSAESSLPCACPLSGSTYIFPSPLHVPASVPHKKKRKKSVTNEIRHLKFGER